VAAKEGGNENGKGERSRILTYNPTSHRKEEIGEAANLKPGLFGPKRTYRPCLLRWQQRDLLASQMPISALPAPLHRLGIGLDLDPALDRRR
jgi:hypothetical protein